MAVSLSVCQKSFAEFAARYGGEQVESFFAATCAWQKILCAERVFFRSFMGGKARVGAISNFVKKGLCPFLTSSKGDCRNMAVSLYTYDPLQSANSGVER